MLDQPVRRTAPSLGAPKAPTTLTALPPLTRYSLRMRAPEPTGFGVDLPPALRAAQAGERAALWLGPDEWLLLAPEHERPDFAIGGPHSLVEISHRQVAFRLAGPAARRALNSGCPLDLDLAAFPTGMCTRTVFAKAEIVLWRTEPEAFHIEIWRSFAPYVRQLLEGALCEPA